MSVYGTFLSDEQFQCSICLDVFTNPSSTPCGHSFCMPCISRYWDGMKVCQCPLCKKTFQKRPDLQINRTLREITEQFRSMKGGGGMGQDKRGGRRENGEDFFHELQKRVLRPTPNFNDFNEALFQGQPIQTCYSPTNSQCTNQFASSVPNESPMAALVLMQTQNLNSIPPSWTYPNRRRFTLSGAADSNNLPLCDIHQRGILLYCREDQMTVCPECAASDHPDHNVVNIETEWVKTKAQLSTCQVEIQEMIRERIKKIEEIKKSVIEMELAVERETAGSVCMLSALVSAIERSQAELMEVMEMSRRAAGHQANAMIRQLETEVGELRKRENALAKLSQSDDHIHCLKTFPALSVTPPAKDWTGVSVNSDLGTGTIYRSLTALVDKFQEELKTMVETGFPASVLEPSPVRTQPKMKRVQEYAVEVTLDSDTAHPRLILSEDLKSVRCGDRHQLVPDNPERFDRVVCVLGREAISSGRHYWEVEVGGKTDWDLGVAKQSINRKGKIEVTPNNGYWFLSLRDKSKYAFRTEPSTDVPLNLRPNKIGIFVDFEKGQVSFYNVDAKIHIYTFNDIFNESIYPFFSPFTNKSGKNDGPLVVTPVNPTE